MSKYKRPIIYIAIILWFCVYGTRFYDQTRTFSFNDLIMEHIDGTEIDSIYILKSKEIQHYSIGSVKEKKEIELVMKSLPEMKVQKGSSGLVFPEFPRYHLTIKGENGVLLGFFISEKGEILLYDYEKSKDKTQEYKITNEFVFDKLKFLDQFLKEIEESKR
ncbi:hypothetical protein [Paenibacillus dendritiformis]|nr:hypothetical protein [Paenibacillus dendritiformis]CAH8768831.1 hypothetical protein H7S4_001529 [Paenibacillus dendritiformis]